MKWYKFWKKSGPNQSYLEDFIELNEKWYETEEDIKGKCEEWAETVGGGFNTHYSYGFIEINKPPDEWLLKEIKKLSKRIEDAKKDIEHYQELLK